MRIAVYPGSFDPLTNGHVDVALRAKKFFDKVIIMVADNASKKGHYLFSAEERVEMAKETFASYEGFEVVSTDKLVVKEAKKLSAQALIRGLRAVTDYEMEFQLLAEADIDGAHYVALAPAEELDDAEEGDYVILQQLDEDAARRKFETT